MIIGAALVAVPMIIREVAGLIQDIPALFGWLQVKASPWLLSTFNIDPFDVSLEGIKHRLLANWQQAGGLAGRVLHEVTASGAALLTALVSILLTPVVAFYLMRDWDDVIGKLHDMIPRHMEETTVGLVRECDEVLSQFLRGQLLIMFILGCIYALGLSLIGLKTGNADWIAGGACQYCAISWICSGHRCRCVGRVVSVSGRHPSCPRDTCFRRGSRYRGNGSDSVAGW